MKNKFFIILFIIFVFNISTLNLAFTQQFNFNVTEIEILDNGNLFKGLKRGVVETDNGIKINANTFIYNKLTNILEAEGEVRIEDEINDYIIFSDTAVYQRNEEIVYADGNSKAIDGKNREITANKITYKKIPNTIKAEGEVRIEDEINDYEIFSEKITYFIFDEIVKTNGSTEGKIISKYNIKSKDVNFNFRSKKLSSKSKSIINDQNNQIYYMDEFEYYIEDELLKGKEIITITNYNLPNSDKFYFSEGIFNLKTKKFIAKDTEINVHKNIFARNDNDPRIFDVYISN